MPLPGLTHRTNEGIGQLAELPQEQRLDHHQGLCHDRAPCTGRGIHPASIPQRSNRIMAQSNDEIARDIMVAWLSGNAVSFSLADAEKTGEAIGKVYKAVLQAVREGSSNGAS